MTTVHKRGSPTHWTPVFLCIQHVDQHALQGVLEHGQSAKPPPSLGDGVVGYEEAAEEEHEGQQSGAHAIALNNKYYREVFYKDTE